MMTEHVSSKYLVSEVQLADCSLTGNQRSPRYVVCNRDAIDQRIT